MKSFYNNPFISCTARDMSYSDVMRFWCSPYECYNINEMDLKHSTTPIIIEGARGSGKTMILKHLSFFCQKETFNSNNLLDEISEQGYIGVYFRYSSDYGNLFDSLNCSKLYRENLFSNYFQLCVSLEISRILISVEQELNNDEKTLLYKNLSNLIGEQLLCSDDLMKFLEKSIITQDEKIRRSQYLTLGETQSLEMKSFLFDLIYIIQSSVSKFNEVLFIIIIDEYENVGDYQHIINTYIKQMEGSLKYTFRIGVRPEGIREYTTNVSEEFLQDGRDFIKKQLAINSNDRTSNYSKFVKSVIDRRLKTNSIFQELNICIEDLLGNREDYEEEALSIVKNRKDHFSDILEGKTQEEKDLLLSVISDKSPLVESYFIMRYKRGETLENIATTKKHIESGYVSQYSKKYKSDFQNKYKASLLFWLADKYTVKKQYYSFSTFLYLSCGSIYDFIGLCRTVFDELESDYFSNFDNCKKIPNDIQTKAAIKYAESQLEKIRINHDYGPQMHLLVKNMCSLFGFYHKGDLCTTYPETNQFYISGNFDVAGINREIWRSLIRWGIIIKKNSYQRATLTVNSKAQLYYFNKSYFPVFGISCRIRGGFNFELTNEIWDKMTTSLVDPSSLINSTKKKFKQSNNVPPTKNTLDNKSEQLSLFDWEDSNE